MWSVLAVPERQSNHTREQVPAGALGNPVWAGSAKQPLDLRVREPVDGGDSGAYLPADWRGKGQEVEVSIDPKNANVNSLKKKINCI